MAFVNNMTSLLNKIERKLGTRPLNLPDHLQKSEWANVIIEDTLTTFSRFYPYAITYVVNPQRDKGRGNYYLIDENIISSGVKILGVRDIKWDEFTPNSVGINNQPYGMYDFYSSAYDMDDMMLLQTRADQLSLFNNGLFVEYKDPNQIVVKNSSGVNVCVNVPEFKIELLIKHSENLTTIAPTKMETFENLAKADIATFLYHELKYYEGLDTVFASIELRLDDLGNEASKRDDIVAKLEEGYVSAGNNNQPIMYTI